jgi:hypothetical protein
MRLLRQANVQIRQLFFVHTAWRIRWATAQAGLVLPALWHCWQTAPLELFCEIPAIKAGISHF